MTEERRQRICDNARRWRAEHKEHIREYRRRYAAERKKRGVTPARREATNAEMAALAAKIKRIYEITSFPVGTAPAPSSVSISTASDAKKRKPILQGKVLGLAQLAKQEYFRRWRAEHKEYLRAASRRYYAKHRGRILAIAKEKRTTGVLPKSKARALTPAEKNRRREYYYRNKDEIRERCLSWNRRNVERLHEYNRRRYAQASAAASFLRTIGILPPDTKVTRAVKYFALAYVRQAGLLAEAAR